MTRNSEPCALPHALRRAADGQTELAVVLQEYLLHRATLDGHAVDAELQRLEPVHGPAVHAELIFLLSHLRFAPAAARDRWRAVLAHADELTARLGSPLDIRIALLSYFLHVDRQLEHPMTIELRVFEQARECAYRDELTGLHNYRFFGEILEREIARCERSMSPLSLILIDVDRFKEINDRLGHEEGNVVLADVARVLGRTARKDDYVVRYGGDEFGLLAALSKPEALALAERAREMLLAETRPHAVTASLGVATFPGDARTAGELVRSADRALYDAKRAGRDQVQGYRASQRSYHRVVARLTGVMHGTGPEVRPFTTANVSEGGMCVITDAAPTASLYEVELSLPDGHSVRHAAARLVDARRRPDGRHDVALRFVDMSADDRARLARWAWSAAPSPAEADGEALERSLPAY